MSRFADMRGRRRSMTGDPFTAQRKGKKISISRIYEKTILDATEFFFTLQEFQDGLNFVFCSIGGYLELG